MGEIVRLQKYIAMSGAASRRAAEKMIDEGRVSVNGEMVTGQGVKVEIGNDRVEIDGVLVKAEIKKIYIALNKPEGYVTTVKDQFDRPTVMDLVSKEIHTRIFPVGRLDYETEGLILMTNDGDWANRVTHPRYESSKKYYAVLKGVLTIPELNKIRRGIMLDGKKTSPAECEIMEIDMGMTLVEITIHEGRNRQVRRMFEAVGHEVKKLRREKIGIVELGNLREGRWRYLTSGEIEYFNKK
ncbi:MAG: rRNA pseudouridine synthase [Oscillospiraceae bacterium]|nr:rRNA pseudouridine synthase [Oscillospiraceae bacterium]